MEQNKPRLKMTKSEQALYFDNFNYCLRVADITTGKTRHENLANALYQRSKGLIGQNPKPEDLISKNRKKK